MNIFINFLRIYSTIFTLMFTRSLSLRNVFSPISIRSIVAVRNIHFDSSFRQTKLQDSISQFSTKSNDLFKLPRVYFPNKITIDTDLSLSSDLVHYLVNVIRIKNNNPIRIFNDQYGEFLGEVAINSRGRDLKVYIREKLQDPNFHSDLPLTLYFAPIKKPAMKILLNKATELGVTSLVPVITQNTNSAFDNDWKTVLIESVEQSERFSIPNISETITLTDLLNELTLKSTEQKVLVCRERSNNLRVPILKELISFFESNSTRKLGIFCGPEGGFTTKEWEMMESVNKESLGFVSLSGNVLRAETASISALSCVSAVYEHQLFLR